MARVKKVEQKKGIDPVAFKSAIDYIAKEKNVSTEAVVLALKESFEKAYQKYLGAEDADIHVSITDEPASIEIYVTKDVIDDDEDDENAYEIPLSSAKKIDPSLKIGDKCNVFISVDELATMATSVIRNVFKQKLYEVEKTALYDEFKGKTGEMITGEVERCEDRGCLVNIGRTSIYLPRKEMIGDEHYEPGDQIRVYIADVSNSETGKGPSIKISRSDAGFIRRLFEEEVFDIYDGTVIIKDVARNAGIRTKMSVYSNDPNVDPIGSCIGINGSSIQKINAQLGNGREKEKIDIIQYSQNIALYIIDALRPATISKIFVDEDNKEAIAIVPDGQLSLAIGRKGANARVASALTGYQLLIKEEHEADEIAEERGIEFSSPEDIRKEDAARIKKENYEKYLASIKAKQAEESATSNAGLEKVKPIKITDEFLNAEKPAEEPVQEPAIEEEKPVEVKSETPVEEEKPVEEVKKVEKVETPAPAARSINVKTTTTLESLEKELEEEKKKESSSSSKKNSKRPRKITEDEQPHETVKIDPLKNSMPIYSEEELEEIEALENEDDDFYDDDFDYDDFDSYYDDDK